MNMLTDINRHISRYAIVYSLLFMTVLSNQATGQDIILSQNNASTATELAGKYFTYTINFSCSNTTDNTPCQNVIISDTLPLGLEFKGPLPNNAYVLSNPGNGLTVLEFEEGDYQGFTQNGIFRLNIGDVPAGASGLLILTARYKPWGGVPDGFATTNTVHIASDNDVNPTNNSDTATVSNEASVLQNLVKLAEPRTGGGRQFSATTSPLDAATYYNIDKFAIPDIRLQGANYFNDAHADRIGGLAIYNPFIVDILEPGLTCGDIDAANTSNGYVCLAPGQTDSRVGYTHPASATGYAVVWDLTQHSPSGSGTDTLIDPMVLNNPCGYPNFHCSDYFEWRRRPSLQLGVFYRSSDGFSIGQNVTNTAELWGRLPSGNLVNLTANMSLSQDAQSTTLVSPNVSSLFYQSLRSTINPNNQTFIGDELFFSVFLKNDGNVPLTNVYFVDTIPAEGDLSQIFGVFVNYTETYEYIIYYSDGTSENVTGLQGNKILKPGNDFTIPTGAYVTHIKMTLNAPLLPGGEVYFRPYLDIQPTRVSDDYHTANYDNPNFNPDPDAGGQLAGSPVNNGDYVTNCAIVSTTETGIDYACTEAPVGDITIGVQPVKYSAPNFIMQEGDTVTFGLNPIRNIITTTNINTVTVSDTLPPNLKVVPNSSALQKYNSAIQQFEASANTMNLVINSFSVVSNVNGSGRDLVEIEISGAGGVIDAVSLPNDRTMPTFKAVIQPGHVGGATTNEYQITGLTAPISTGLYQRYGAGQNPYVTTANGLEDVNSTFKAEYKVAGLPEGVSIALADADISAGVSGSEQGTPGSIATYMMQLRNTGNIGLTDIKIVDLLPRVGDVGSSSLAARGTDWHPIFMGNIKVQIERVDGTRYNVNPTIYYSTSVNPCRAEYIIGETGNWPSGCTNDFSTTVPSNLAAVKAFALQLGNATVELGELLRIEFDVQMLNPTPTGMAWNNFSWRAVDSFEETIEVGAESPRSGITADPPLESCADGTDNDGNGLIDCADPYCQSTIDDVTFQNPTCVNPTGGQIAITVNNITGLIQYSVNNTPSYQTSNTFLNLERGQYIVRIKNDAGCETAYSTPVVFDIPDCVEICNNGIDDDGDGLVDCDDNDCEPLQTANRIDEN